MEIIIYSFFGDFCLIFIFMDALLIWYVEIEDLFLNIPYYAITLF